MVSKEVEKILIQKSKDIEINEWIEFVGIDYWNHNVDNKKAFALIFKKERQTKLLSNNSDENYINIIRIVTI